MAYEEHDPEIVSIWIRRVLTGDAAVSAIINQRAYDDVGVIRTTYPFVYWTVNELYSQKNSEGVYRIDWQADVRGVWKFGPGQASRSPCRPLTKAMNKALTDNGFPHFSLPGVGSVHECTFLSFYRPPFRDEGDFRIIEHGVSVKLVTSC